MQADNARHNLKRKLSGQMQADNAKNNAKRKLSGQMQADNARHNLKRKLSGQQKADSAKSNAKNNAEAAAKRLQLSIQRRPPRNWRRPGARPHPPPSCRWSSTASWCTRSSSPRSPSEPPATSAPSAIPKAVVGVNDAFRQEARLRALQASLQLAEKAFSSIEINKDHTKLIFRGEATKKFAAPEAYLFVLWGNDGSDSHEAVVHSESEDFRRTVIERLASL